MVVLLYLHQLENDPMSIFMICFLLKRFVNIWKIMKKIRIGINAIATSFIYSGKPIINSFRTSCDVNTSGTPIGEYSPPEELNKIPNIMTAIIGPALANAIIPKLSS